MKRLIYAKELLEWAKKELAKAGVDCPQTDADLLLSHFLKLKKHDFYLSNPPISRLNRLIFKRSIRLRSSRYPLQYILGNTEFLGYKLNLERGVFIPRQETELLVLEAIKIAKEMAKNELNVLEIGTGSGNIAISLTKNVTNCKIIACDISRASLKVAGKNAKSNGLSGEITFIKSDLFGNVSEDIVNRFDIIISNPPYVKKSDLSSLAKELSYEDRKALDGGDDGLDFYRRIFRDGSRFLKFGGFFIFEIGADQRRGIVSLLSCYPQLGEIKFIFDHAGYDRIVIVKKV